MHPTEPNLFAQWRADCPRCHNRDCLAVFEFTDNAGRKRNVESRLHPDGFETGLSDAFVRKHGGDTDEEKVRCDVCGVVFELHELLVGN